MSLNSDVDVTKIKYHLVIKEWSKTKLSIQAVFANPSLLSGGYVNDKILVKVKNPAFFVSARTGKQMPGEFTEKEFWISIPQQLPEGVSQVELEADLDTARQASYSILIT